MAKLAQGAFVVYKLVNGDSIFACYNDNSLDNYPAAPVGDGTTKGWHRTLTATSKWRCEKVAQSELLGAWGEPAPISGKDLFPTPILSLLPAHTAVCKSSSRVFTPTTTSCRKVLQVNGQTEVIGVDPPIMYRGRNLARNSRASTPWTGNKDTYQISVWLEGGNYIKIGHTYTVLSELYVDEELAATGKGITFWNRGYGYPSPAFNPTVPTIIKYTFTADCDGYLCAYHGKGMGTPGNSYINWVVVVEGDVATEDWIPAPEDCQITCNGAAYSDGTDVAIPASATSLSWELKQYDKVIDKETVPVVSDGANGEAGKYPVQEYKVSASQPTGAGSRTPPAITKGQLLWMRIGEVVPPNTEPTTWSEYVRISGEKGEAGADGIKNPYRDYSFALSSQSTTTDPSTSPVIDGTWADIPPVVITDKYLWQRVSYYSVTAANEWTKTPAMSYVRLSGEDGRVGVNLINYHFNAENDMWRAWFASTAGEGEQVTVSEGVITGTSKGGSPASYNSIINRMDWLFGDYHKILSIGKQFTLSFWARGDNSVSEVRIGNPSGGSHVDIFAKSFNVGAEWQQHKITFTVAQEFTSGSMLLFRLGGAVATTLYQLQIKDVKLESGDRATAWITSPNDADYPTKYLRNALKDGKAVINPDGIDGLMLGNVLGVVPPVNGEYSLRNMRAGMSGIADDGIAFFAHPTDAYNVARKYLSGESRVRPNYAVTDTGKLISNDADIEGRITATSGKIGYFNIVDKMFLESGDTMTLSSLQLRFSDKSRKIYIGKSPMESSLDLEGPTLAHLEVLQDIPNSDPGTTQDISRALFLDAQKLNSIALDIKGKIRMNDMIATTGYFDIGNGSINSGKYGTVRIHVTNGIITRLQAI